MVSVTQCPIVSVCGNEMMRGAAAPEGPITYDSILDRKGGKRKWWRLGRLLRPGIEGNNWASTSDMREVDSDQRVNRLQQDH